LLAASGALALSGCSNPSIDPVDWWHNLEGGPLAETRPPPPNADAPYPNLGQVPPKPAPPDPATRNAISAGLVADRANAQYTASLSPLQVTPPNALAAPPPLPNNAANADQTSNATLAAANAPPPARIVPLGPPQPPLPNTTPNPPRPAPAGDVTASPLPPLVAQTAPPAASSDNAAQASATPLAPAAPPASAPSAAPTSSTTPPPAAAAEAPVSSPSGPAVPLSSDQATPPHPAPTPLAPPTPPADTTAAAAAPRPPAPPRPAPPRASAPTAVAAAAPTAAPPAPGAPGPAASALLPGMPEHPPPMVQLSGTSLPTQVAPTPAPTPPVAPPAPVAPPQPGAPVTIAFTPGSAVLPTTALAPLKMLVQRHGDSAIAVTGYGEAASADPATLPAALQLALARARSIAANLLAAGVPSSSIRIATQARGNGGAAQIVSN
jgi:outer membrane protein OmpA-like peptidoglycan-associated protein